MQHALAYVHPDAKIGNNVTIDPFVNIQGDVEIGEGTWIGSNVTIMEGTRIGRNCKIFPGAVIGGTPQDLKFAGEKTTVQIGDNTSVREFVTINRGTKASGTTRVGSDCLLMAYVHVAHDCVVGNRVVLANAVTLGGHVEVDDWAVIGGVSAVHQFVKIGKHVMLRGGSLVGKDVPPYVTAAHDPLTYAGINSTGLRRREFDEDQITQIQDVYRTLFVSKLNISQALEVIQNEYEQTPEVLEILNFMNQAQRGVIRGVRGKTNEE
jgi:UDP-N-acetylglucosamine acyltransferase